MAAVRGRWEARITVPAGGWDLTVNDSDAAGGVTATVAAGSYFLSSIDASGGGTKSFLDAVRDALNDAAPVDTFAVTMDGGEGGGGKVTIAASGTSTITWVDTELRDLLGFDTNLAAGTSWTGAGAAQALWLPDCNYSAPNELDGTWWGEPDADYRSSENAAGYVFVHVGQSKTVLEGLVYEAISRHRAIEANESTVNESFESFVYDGVWGFAAWGTPGGPLRLYPDADNSAVHGTYRVPSLKQIRFQHFSAGYVAGSRRIEMPRLVRVPGTEDEGAWELPDNATEWAAIFPTVTVPTNLWPCQDSALPLVDTIGGKDMASGNASGDEYVQQTGDPLDRYAAYLEDIQSHLRPSATTDLDLTTNDFSVFFRFKVDPAEVAASGHHFVRKKSSSASTNGWAVKFNGSNGYLDLIFDSPAAAQTTITVSANHFDGDWHWCLAVLDRTNALLKLYTDLGSASASIAGHAGGSLTNATYFGLGDTNGNLNAAVKCYYSYLAAWVGTALTSTHFDIMRGA